MKIYLKDEEEDMYWSEQQLDLCKNDWKAKLPDPIVNKRSGFSRIIL